MRLGYTSQCQDLGLAACYLMKAASDLSGSSTFMLTLFVVPLRLSLLLGHLKLSMCIVKSIGEPSSGMSREAAGSEGARLYLAQRDVSGAFLILGHTQPFQRLWHHGISISRS